MLTPRTAKKPNLASTLRHLRVQATAGNPAAVYALTRYLLRARSLRSPDCDTPTAPQARVERDTPDANTRCDES